MKDKFLIKLEDIYKRYCELSDKLADPAVISDTAEWTKTAKDQAEIAEPSLKYAEYVKTLSQLESAKEAIVGETDPEMKELLETEIAECGQKLEAVKDELKILLLPKDKNDDRNCIVEIRGGAGGEEASLFAYELYRMYLNYCERHRLKTARARTNSLNSKAACTACSAFPKRNRKAGCIRPPSRSPFFPKPTTSMSKSRTRISAWTCTVRRARADRR